MADTEPVIVSGYSTSSESIVAGILSRLWWVLLLRGMALIVLGGYALLVPDLTLAAFVQILGLFVILDGILAAVAGLMGWTESRVWTVVRAILAIAIGLFVVGHPLVVGAIAMMTVIFLIAFQSIVGGLLEIYVAVRERDEIQGEGWLVLSGLFSVLLGFLLALIPLTAGLLLIRFAGIFIAAFGLVLVVSAFRARRLRRTVDG